jgi:hypothetical protein
MTNTAWTKDAPSRAALKGCAWEKLSDATLGLEGWIQHCDFGFRMINLYAKQNALMIHWSDGGEDTPLVETFDLPADEKPESVIKRIFAEHTSDKSLVARCLLKPYRDEDPHAPPPPAGVKRYTFQPNAALRKELDAKQDPNDVPDPPCGDWGYAPDGIQYFETHSGARKVLFVRVGQDEPLFDEKTLHVLPPAK